jgi:phospholipid-binding lipoprotein MlaA
MCARADLAVRALYARKTGAGTMMRGLSRFFVVCAGLLLAGCATDPTGANDPYQDTNRAVFNFNNKVDEYVLAPTARAYVAVVPDPARQGVHNFLLNLDLPVTFANDLLQGEMDRAGDTLGRFTINSTLGIGGLLDPASDFGIPYHKEDFGQTLGTWGVGEGPYLVLPLLGSDPPRDAAGQVVDIFLDPSTYIPIREHFWWSAGRRTLAIIDLRSRNLDTVESIERGSVDYYASVRSLYRQLRNNEIRNGQPDVKNLPDL